MFKSSTAADASAATIETPWGPINSDTPEAERYRSTKAVADALAGLIQGIQGMVMTKPEALAALGKLQEIAPAGDKYLREDLEALRVALAQGADFAAIIVSLEHGHLSRINFGLSCLAGAAPAPVRPGTITKADPRHSEHPTNVALRSSRPRGY